MKPNKKGDCDEQRRQLLVKNNKQSIWNDEYGVVKHKSMPKDKDNEERNEELYEEFSASQS